jgi:hypothetical protein
MSATEPFDRPDGLVPQELSEADSHEYEQRTVAYLRDVLIGRSALVIMDAIELVGSRPDTSVVFRYHYRPESVGRHPGLVPGPQAEIARLWDFAIDPDDHYSQGLMDEPTVLAAAIGSAFEAAELPLADPDTLREIGSPPKVYPRIYDVPPPPST